jgi:hypothetical protein
MAAANPSAYHLNIHGLERADEADGVQDFSFRTLGR